MSTNIVLLYCTITLICKYLQFTTLISIQQFNYVFIGGCARASPLQVLLMLISQKRGRRSPVRQKAKQWTINKARNYAKGSSRQKVKGKTSMSYSKVAK